MNSEDQQQLDVLRLEIAALKARIAVLEAHGRDARPWPVLPGPFYFAPQMPPTWWPFTGPTCIDTTAAHEAPPSDPSPACPSPTSGAGGGT